MLEGRRQTRFERAAVAVGLFGIVYVAFSIEEEGLANDRFCLLTRPVSYTHLTLPTILLV